MVASDAGDALWGRRTATWRVRGKAVARTRGLGVLKEKAEEDYLVPTTKYSPSESCMTKGKGKAECNSSSFGNLRQDVQDPENQDDLEDIQTDEETTSRN